MELSDILRPEAVKVFGTVTSKKRLFQDLGDMVAGIHDIDGAIAFSALQERESLGPTGVGHGVALPHARIAGITNVIGAFVRVERPFDFDAVDRQPVDLVFALFAPEGAGVEHLKALALVSRTMRDSAVCSKLRANGDPTTLHALLTETQKTRAA
ncbi:PTS sugar transporter subunit IIA [Aliiroseovarius subalbicans]|uniref:PTS sugar transporter subunit IIA n=1 Tax=Aliiroseovarius subalbicans TaxID=2925840 RepID=UPI001F5AE3E1|nr:PTS sugar transporter subunit IIA [Aliiroseovarius subalbicans]MCI2400116.1 PTS sugar transporter subunit IIA [Aliiroseovarius subalbicans]